MARVPRSKTWLADWIRQSVPTREQLEGNRYLRPVAHHLLHPALWRFTRRSVPRAVGLGLLVGIFLLIPGVQFVSAALIAIPARANLPVTIGVTLLSNPVTTPLILVGSLWIGSTVFGLPADPGAVMEMIREQASIREWWDWLLSSAAPSLLSGLAAISIVSGAVGYALSGLLWRWWIARKWRARGHTATHLNLGHRPSS